MVKWEVRKAKKNVGVEMKAWLIDEVSEIWMVEEGIDQLERSWPIYPQSRLGGREIELLRDHHGTYSPPCVRFFESKQLQ